MPLGSKCSAWPRHGIRSVGIFQAGWTRRVKGTPGWYRMPALAKNLRANGLSLNYNSFRILLWRRRTVPSAKVPGGSLSRSKASGGWRPAIARGPSEPKCSCGRRAFHRATSSALLRTSTSGGTRRAATRTQPWWRPNFMPSASSRSTRRISACSLWGRPEWARRIWRWRCCAN